MHPVSGWVLVNHRLAGREAELVQIYGAIGFDDTDARFYYQVQRDLRQHLGLSVGRAGNR